MVRPRRSARRRRPRPGHPRRRTPRRGQGLQRRRGHQGDAGLRGLRRTDRRQPRMLRRVPRGLRVRGPGHRRSPGLLPRRRSRPGRQRRLHRGERRRVLRDPRGGPGRPGRGHAPLPDGPAAPDAHALLHRPQHRGHRPRAARLGARGGSPRTPRRGSAGGGRRDRAQGHPGDPDGQGGDQRDRPRRRQPQLSLRAGLHDGAQPRGGRGRASRCVCRHRQGGARSEHAQQGDVRRGRRRPDQGRDDRRHRWLGLAAQADGAGARDPAQRPEGPHDRVVRRPGRGPASPVRQGVPRRLRVRDAGLDPARAAVLACSPGGHCVVPRVGRGHVPDRPSCCRAAGPVPADARRARLRRTRERPVAAHRHQPVRRRGGARRRTRSRARRGAGAHEPCRPVRQRAVPRAGPLLRRPVLHGREGGVRLDRADHRHRRHDRGCRDPDDAAQPHDGHRCRGDAQRGALHDVHADLRA